MAKSMVSLDTLVLDEADQLLEMGFRPAILKILDALPPKVCTPYASACQVTFSQLRSRVNHV